MNLCLDEGGNVRRTGERFMKIFTINIELVQLSPDVPTIHLVQQQVLDAFHQARTCEVGMDDEIRGIHVERLAVSFVIDVLVPTTKSSRIACRLEEVQFLGCCGGEVNEPKKTMSLTGAPAYDWNHAYLESLLP